MQRDVEIRRGSAAVVAPGLAAILQPGCDSRVWKCWLCGTGLICVGILERCPLMAVARSEACEVCPSLPMCLCLWLDVAICELRLGEMSLQSDFSLVKAPFSKVAIVH